MLHEHFQRAFSLKRLLAGQKLVEHDAHRVKVGLGREVSFASALLRRHVGCGADGAIDLGDGGAIKVLGDAEVGEFDGAVFEHHDVGRLQIAMDDALVVGVLQSGAKLWPRRTTSSQSMRPRRAMTMSSDSPSTNSMA